MATLLLALGEPRSHLVHLRRAHGELGDDTVVYLEPDAEGMLTGTTEPFPLADWRGPRRDGAAFDAVPDEAKALEAALLTPIEAAAAPRDAAHYAELYQAVFASLDRYDGQLADRRFLGGEEPSMADWLLYTILLRLDLVYSPLFKLNRSRLRDFDQLLPYVRDLYQRDPVVDAVDPVRIKGHHFWQPRSINHRTLVPRGNGENLALPHDRHRFDGQRDLRAIGTEEQAGARPTGAWRRKQSGFRAWIGDDAHPPQAGRYHIYVSHNCPWSHRVNLTRSLLGLQEAISLDILYYRRDPDRGWQFRPEEPGCTEDSLFGHRFVVELYEKLGSEEKSVPVLYDRVAETIVSNESSEILRMLDRSMRPFAADDAPELCPPALEDTIDRINAWVYTDINNGAYKAGFTHSQTAYDVAFERFFAALDRLEAILDDERPYLLGDAITEADVRLFPTIFRFDPVYFNRFRLNRAMIRDYPHLSAWHDRVAALPAVAEASNLDHCRKGYFGRTGNGIVPLGPAPERAPA